jgi:hypothetical protein
MSDEVPSAVEAVAKYVPPPPSRWQRFADWLFANWKPCVMVAIIVAGYVVKKSGHYTEDEVQLLEGLWLAFGLGAVFTPNFKRTPKDPA